MNGLQADGMALVNELSSRYEKTKHVATEIAVCPPFTLVSRVAEHLSNTSIRVGGQDCSPAENGPHTGDVSAEMLANAGCTLCILGHSERRTDYEEDDELVRSKTEAVHRANLRAIICIGETEGERDAGRTIEVVTRQLTRSVPGGTTAANTVIAYEPVWAIGTGRTPNMTEIAEVHIKIRDLLCAKFASDGHAIRIQYGGSVNPGNARDILQIGNVNGALVGGASLKASSFWDIIDACPPRG